MFRSSCSEYIYKGKKFNARKETVENEVYFGIKIFRFYIKCTRCSAEITFKTDPKNTDYIAEHGAARNFEPWRDTEEKSENPEDRLAELEREEQEEEENDAMKALENRTVDSKREMDILDKLQEIRGRNARIERADPSQILDRISSRADPEEYDEEERLAILQKIQEEEEDEELVKKYFARGVIPPPSIELDETPDVQDALPDENGADGEDGSAEAGPSTSTLPSEPIAAKAPVAGPSVKRKLVEIEPDAHSLLSEEARKIASSVSFKPPPLPKKKSKTAGSSLLGIKPKSAPKK